MSDDDAVLVPESGFPPPTAPTGGLQVQALLQQAIERGGDVAESTMRTIYELATAEREDARRVACAQAVSAFRAEVPLIPKTGTLDYTSDAGGQGARRHAKLDVMESMCREPMSRHGLSIRFGSVELLDNGRARIHGTLVHSGGYERTEFVDLPVQNRSGMSDQQKVVSVQTIGMRMLMRALLNLVDTDEDTGGADPEDALPIEAAQVADLETLLDETGKDPEAFLRWCGAETLADVTQARYREALRYFARLKAKAGREPGEDG